jgi:hypothetical protein
LKANNALETAAAGGRCSASERATSQMNKPPQLQETSDISGSAIRSERAPAHLNPLIKIGCALIALILAACVQVDPETNKTLPRGNQKYKFATVEKRAEQLRDGISKFEALVLLGSPAESSDDGDTWTYLPERPAVIVPTRGLRLEFQNGILIKHGYTTVAFGKAL